MKKDTRTEILQTSKKLFNEYGYNAVSVKDIADALEISKGNVTYHFKKKEQIMEALLKSLESERRLPSVPQTIAELDDVFYDKQNVIQSNAFYFWHHTQMAQLSPEIRERQQQIYQENRSLYDNAFDNLIQAGTMQPVDAAGRLLQGEVREQLIDALLMGSIYWLPYRQIKHAENKTSVTDYCWSLMIPWLSEKGLKELSDLKHM